jgi:hypothetical protein
MRWRIVAAVVLGLPLTAHAQATAPAPFHLRWSGPPSCPRESDVVQETERLLGASTAAPLAVPIEAEAQVAAGKRGFELLLRVGPIGYTRARSLEAPRCEELAHAAALVVALAVDPALSLASADGTDVPPSSVPPVCPEPAVPPAPPPCPVCSRSPPPPLPTPSREAATPAWHVAFVAGTSIAYGALPRSLPRANLGVAYRAQSYWLELSAGAAFASSERLARGRVATFAHWYGAPRFCVEPDLGWARLGGCALAEVGVLKASGFGVTLPQTQRDWWLAPGVGVQVSRRLASRAELVLGADVLLAAVRPRFELASEPIFRPHLFIPGLRLALVGGLF